MLFRKTIVVCCEHQTKNWVKFRVFKGADRCLPPILHTEFHFMLLYQEDKRKKPGNLLTKRCYFETINVFHALSVALVIVRAPRTGVRFCPKWGYLNAGHGPDFRKAW